MRQRSIGVGIYALYLHNLGVLRKLSQDLISQRVGDLCIHTGIADVPVSQVIGNIFDTFTGLKKMHSDGVAKGMDMSGVDSCGQMCVPEGSRLVKWIP